MLIASLAVSRSGTMGPDRRVGWVLTLPAAIRLGNYSFLAPVAQVTKLRAPS